MGCFVLTLSCFAGCGSTDSASKDAKDADENVTFPYDEFTVKFDANTTPDDLTDDESFTYWTKGWDSKKKTSTVTYKATADAYIHEDDVPIPTRKGYYFAGGRQNLWLPMTILSMVYQNIMCSLYKD